MAFECPLPFGSYDSVTLGHGGGGKLSQQLITQLFLPMFENPYLRELHDGAQLGWPGSGRIAFTTDTFVISPLFFPGGDIGSLAVFGTANDLAMCGARPLYLSLSLILEEGFPIRHLWQILSSIRDACHPLQLQVVTGDTKVVEKGKGDGIFINTTGIGEILPGVDISPRRILPGDRIVLSGPIADHGVSILSVREGLSFETSLQSDSGPLWPAVQAVLEEVEMQVHAMRDATRGGIASALNEMAGKREVGMVIDEDKIPLREEVKGACEILGLDPLYVANEGKCVLFVAPDAVDKVLEIMHLQPMMRQACVIGRVVTDHPGVVRLETAMGASRVIDMMSGEQLPRIC